MVLTCATILFMLLWKMLELDHVLTTQQGLPNPQLDPSGPMAPLAPLQCLQLLLQDYQDPPGPLNPQVVAPQVPQLPAHLALRGPQGHLRAF